MKNRLIQLLVTITLCILVFGEARAQNIEVRVQLLGRDDCTHCREEKAFLEKLQSDRKDIVFEYLDIDKEENYQRWLKLTQLEQIPRVTPITLVGRTLVQGFDSPQTTGQIITSLIDKYASQDSLTIDEYISLGGSGEKVTSTPGECTQECSLENSPLFIKVPFWGGVINVKDYSLPLLAAILGLIDGFNPCAMWVLVSFLIVLAQLRSRKKMWLFAGVFILAEAIMYTLILTLWFTTWDFIKLDELVTPLVGFLAIGGGMFFLWEWKNANGSCQIGNIQHKKNTMDKIQHLANLKFGLVPLIGIITLAFSVNVVEFACSVGIPQAFTKILELNNANFLDSLIYILIYIFMYMVDDFVVFGLALFSFEKIGLTTKYSKWSNLVGGILMLILGSILIFKPELLTLL